MNLKTDKGLMKSLESVVKELNKWKKLCLEKGMMPICVSHFSAVDPEDTESAKSVYKIFGDQDNVMVLLKRTNDLLDTNGGEHSLLNQIPPNDSK